MPAQIDEPKLQAEPRQGVPDVVDTREGYDVACEMLAAGAGSLAADAERASGYRYGHEDWLVQFKRSGSGIVLLDPVALSNAYVDWNKFNESVGDATWIIHDSAQDLPGFAELGLRPAALFDTFIASRLLGQAHFGLAAVTERYLGITLAKEHSAADWSYRPLPRDWRNYAALDVELLIELEAAMSADLKQQGKYEWALEEFDYALAKGMAPREPHATPWMHVSHITVLSHDRRGRAIARELWQTRDRLAREYDIAPTLLLSDHAIIEAAQRKPANTREFRAIRSLNERVRVHTGSEQDKMFERYAPIQRKVRPSVWREAIERALGLGVDELPVMSGHEDDANGNAPRSMRVWEHRHPERYARLKSVRAIIAQIAQDVNMAPEVLIKPQIIRNLCWNDELEADEVASFLREQGARSWQIQLIAQSVSRAIL